MEPVVLTWCPQSFVTVTLMVIVIGLVMALIAQGVYYASNMSNGS